MSKSMEDFQILMLHTSLSLKEMMNTPLVKVVVVLSNAKIALIPPIRAFFDFFIFLSYQSYQELFPDITKYVCLSQSMPWKPTRQTMEDYRQSRVITRQVRSPAAFQANPARTRVSSFSRL